MFLEAINAPDLGILINGRDFAATQSFDEEWGQDVRYWRALGTDGAVGRSVQRSDEDRLTFSFTILKAGARQGFNSISDLKAIRDFDIMTKVGNERTTYSNCNWTRLARSSGIDQATGTVEISAPSNAEK